MVHQYVARYDHRARYVMSVEIERIKAEAFAAGEAAQRERSKVVQVAEPLPIHRAMARNGRIGDVYAHRVYWLPGDET